jgi:hypothetical protein
MKLVRMVTSDPEAEFNNYFNDELVLPPDGKIGMQNISIEKEPQEIDINGDNDLIHYQIIDGQERSIQLDHTSYNDTTYPALLSDITNKLNNSNSWVAGTDDNRYLGVEWSAEIGTDKKVAIGFDSKSGGEYETDWNLNTVGKTAQYYNRTVGQPNTTTNQSFAGFTEYLAKGCGYVRSRIGNLSNSSSGDIESDGYIIGLTNTDISGKPKTITDAEITYGIHITYDGSTYRTIRDGVATGTAINVGFVGAGSTNNDVLECIINGDKVQLNVYVGGSSSPTSLIEYDYFNDNLYPFLIFRSDSTRARASKAGLRLTPSPFATVSDSSTGELGAPPARINNLYENIFLRFGALSLANYLGYDNLRYPSVGGLNKFDGYFWGADNNFEAVDFADSFIVELLDLPLDSYDGLKQQRKNILAVIPKSDADGSLIYEPSTPYFIDIRNTKDILLRNIRARILKSDYSRYKMRGQATLTILIS